MSVPSTETFEGPVLVDGHVHLHACFGLETFLDGAARNFAAAARRTGAGPRPLGVLMMTESAGVHRLGEVRRAAERGGAGAYRALPVEEEESLALGRGDEVVPRLVLIAGRQIVARESLEVLALACAGEIPDRLALSETIERVRRAGGLPVLPWGFGKWWLGRGRLVAGLLAGSDPAELFFGDNGGRLAAVRRPRLLREAERRGFRVLPGSDPLPFPHHAARAGSFGFALRAPFDLRRPAAAVRALLRDPAVETRPYGRGERLLPFVRNQVGMQLRKRGGEAAS